MAKAIKNIFKTETLCLTECADGLYLYDTTQGMNLSMRAKSEQAAFIEALLYYQKRLTKMETDYKILNNKVNVFVSQFDRDED